MMKKFLLAFALMASAALAFSQNADGLAAASIPDPTKAGTGYVTSIGGYLTDAEIGRINALIVKIKNETTAEIAVAVVPSLKEDIFTTAQSLFDAWKIGKSDNDNGLLIIASIEDKDIRTHTGYGMEGIFTDALISFMQNSIVVPEFREGNYGAGIINYLDKIDEILRDPASLEEVRSSLTDAGDSGIADSADRVAEKPKFGEVALPSFIFGGAGLLVLISGLLSLISEIGAVQKNKKKKYDSYSKIAALETKGLGDKGFSASAFFFPFGSVFFSVGLGISGLAGVKGVLLIGILPPAAGLLCSLLAMLWSNGIRKGIMHHWRNDGRLCPECAHEMAKLSEKGDDKYLSPKEITEEKIKSEDYDVWLCASCGAKTIEKYRAGRYSLYIPCPSCSGLTAHQTKREVVARPTYVSAGEALLHFGCVSCGSTFTKSSVIPKLTRSSSSSGSSGSSSHSSSGSSFGGGSSGGGGSTSHW